MSVRDVTGQQATLFAALEGLTPEEMTAPLGDRIDELDADGKDIDLYQAKIALAGFVHYFNRYLLGRDS